MVLNITQVVTTMEQYEESTVAFYGHIVMVITYNNITTGEIHIIGQYEVTKDTNMHQNISDVDLINATGSECLKRVAIELQRRFNQRIDSDASEFEKEE